MITIDPSEALAGLATASKADRDDWSRIRESLTARLGDSMFAVWFAPVELVAVEAGGVLVLRARAETLGWLAKRYGRVLGECAASRSRQVRFLEEQERLALEHPATELGASASKVNVNHKEIS